MLFLRYTDNAGKDLEHGKSYHNIGDDVRFVKEFKQKNPDAKIRYFKRGS